MRAFRRDKLAELDLRTTGMEFASEMVIRAAKAKLDIRQLPIDYHPRGGTSKLSSFRDGWRHLRFLLVHSPTHLFVIPGAAMLLLGVLVGLVSLSPHRGARPRVAAALDDRGLAARRSSGPRCSRSASAPTPTAATSWASASRGSTACAPASASSTACWPAAAIAGAGALIAAIIVLTWIQRGFGVLAEERLLVAASALIIVGLQILFSSFLSRILGLRRRDGHSTDI